MISSSSSTTRTGLRLAALLIAIALLLWLPLEDVSVLGVLLFSAAICAWFYVRFTLGAPQGKMQALLRDWGASALAGLAVTPVALFLMAFKTGIHGHSAPDFTTEQIRAVIASTPVWGLAGLLVGIGRTFLYMALKR